ncbi:MAG: HD-GYP domain-containing protein [Natronincolaceae bacterium]|jgi:HD-GYP domain-containing protein (c-di-GMP phosphodiesterase class II)|nr:HD-GYP domain-containing protein [Bacillota bacterium]NLK90294.1 HD-GYP domain-containing protein [Clostridiales bacterium]
MNLNNKAKIYLGFIAIIATSLYVYLLFNFNIPEFKLLIFWIILSIVVESLLIPMPNNTIGVSVGYAINIATVIVGGPILATISSVLGLLFRIPKVPERGYIHTLNLPAYKTIFNMSQSIIVTSLISLIYLSIGGRVGKFSLFSTLFILFTGILLNTTIISGFLSALNVQKFTRIWLGNIKGTLLSSIAVGTVGIIIALAYIDYGYGAVILFLGPLLLARYSFKLYVDMRNVYLSTIQALIKSLEAKDPFTSGHSNRVEKYAVALAEAFDLSFGRVQNIKIAAALHDIGKIGIDDQILNKAAGLTQEEYQHIMEHPAIGAEIVCNVDFLKGTTGIIKHHHERYDGTGYPDGLKGDEIPIEACILAIADSYDAMTSDRPYRKALTQEEAVEEIEKNAGTQFHPVLAEKFIEVIESRGI